MFDAIVGRYDLLNRVLSVGMDGRWRRAAVAALELPSGAMALDLATGTGDLALEIARRFPDAQVTGVDPGNRMVDRAREKIREEGVADRVRVAVGDARDLPFADDSFDGAAIAFGIRNVPGRDRALREMVRVTRPGRRVVVLELTEPSGGGIAAAARFHVRRVVPRIGAWISGSREYRYLQESIAAFPSPEVFAAQLEAAGARIELVRRFAFGACTLFAAVVPSRS